MVGTIKYQRQWYYAMARSPGRQDVYCPCNNFHKSANATKSCWRKLKEAYRGFEVEVRARSSIRPMDDHKVEETTKEFEDWYVRGDLRKKVKPEQRHKRYTNLKHTGDKE